MTCLSQAREVEILSQSDLVVTAPSTEVLFIGYQENGHHSPRHLYTFLQPSFTTLNLNVTFRNSTVIDDSVLEPYDAVMLYGNLRSWQTTTTWPEVPTLIRYVEGGGAFVPLHVAAACFRFTQPFAALVGGRFKIHNYGVVSPDNTVPKHPIIKNLPTLTATDETYRFKEENPDREILQTYYESEANHNWTWTRNQGKGRVFYTASGHLPAGGDTSIYDVAAKPAFHELVVRGLNWTLKRHFSSVSEIAIAPDGHLSGTGNQLADGTFVRWSSDSKGPRIYAIDGDSVSLNGVDYLFPDQNYGITIPVAGGKSIVSQTVTPISGTPIKGIWTHQLPDLFSEVIFEGKALTNGSSEEIQTIHGDPLATPSGTTITRVALTDDNGVTTESALLLNSDQVLLREGQTIGGVDPQILVGTLDSALLSINPAETVIAAIPLTGSGITSLNDLALTILTGSSSEMILQKGDAVTGLPDVGFQDALHFSINRSGQAGVTTKFINPNTMVETTVIGKIDPSLQASPFIAVATEGAEVATDVFLADLSGEKPVILNNGDLYYLANLSGPGVTSETDRAIFRNSTMIAREGHHLALDQALGTLGSLSSTAQLSCSSEGSLTIVGELIQSGTSTETLFLIQDSLVLPFLQEGEQLTNGPGAAMTIRSINPLSGGNTTSGTRGSMSEDARIAATVETTTDKLLVLRLESLDDIDQDGFSNEFEAAIGSDPLSITSVEQFQTSITQVNGDFIYQFLTPLSSLLPSPLIQISFDLEDWSNPEVTSALASDQSNVPNGYQRMEYLIPSTEDQKFIRLGVQ